MTYLRTVLALLVLLVGACTACASGQLAAVQPAERDLVSRALQSSITLYGSDGDLVCAGTRVAPTVILTAYHCAVAAVLSDAELSAMAMLDVDLNDVAADRILRRTARYSTYGDVLAAKDREDRNQRLGVFERVERVADLALLRTADIGQAYVPVSHAELAVGADIFAIGHPAGLEYTYSRGWVATPCRTAPSLPAGCWTQVDMTIWGGSSGGGLYDTAGQLVGVASMMARPGQGFFTPPQIVAKFLSS